MSKYVYIVTKASSNKEVKVISGISDCTKVKLKNVAIEAIFKIKKEYAKQIEDDMHMFMSMQEGDLIDDVKLHFIQREISNMIYDYHCEPPVSVQDPSKPPPNNYGKEMVDYITPELLGRWLSNSIDTGLRTLIYNIYFNPTLPMNHTIRSKNAKMVERYENGKWIAYRKSFALREIMINCMTIIDAHLIENKQTDTMCLESYLPDTSDAFQALYADVEYMLENGRKELDRDLESNQLPPFVIPGAKTD
jgi:hypothetical protein